MRSPGHAALLATTLALSWACAPEAGDEAGADENAAGDSETAGDSDTGGVEDQHGTVRLRFQPVGGDLSIFAGTAEVRTVANYQDCLIDFYGQNPDWTQAGSAGAPVFNDYLDRLCDELVDVPACTVAEIVQTLDDDALSYSVAVNYTISDPGGLAGSVVHIGPLPTTGLAGCPAQVELRQNAIAGYDAQGTMIWRLATLPGANTATVNQDMAMLVEVTAV